jgi:hypothetical protein
MIGILLGKEFKRKSTIVGWLYPVLMGQETMEEYLLWNRT